MGLRFSCVGVGVGRRNGRLHCWVCTPHREIRARFEGHKHTSLMSLVDEAWGIWPPLAQKTIFVTGWP
jgi:hypothetical protein